jgi:hypothetical protein
MLTFPVIGVRHSLENLTGLSLAAVHRLADSLITGALLERSDNHATGDCAFPVVVRVWPLRLIFRREHSKNSHLTGLLKYSRPEFVRETAVLLSSASENSPLIKAVRVSRSGAADEPVSM